MKQLVLFLLATALSPLILLVGCGPSAQEKKAKSPECLAAKNRVAEDAAKAKSIDLEIKERDDSARRQLENLRLDDRIAQLEGRPVKNQKAEALLESAIRIDELGLKYEPDTTFIDQYTIQQACEVAKPQS
jgi:hypothetical protein